MPRPRRSSARPARYRSPSPPASRRHIAASAQTPSRPTDICSLPSLLQREPVGRAHASHGGSPVTPSQVSGRRSRSVQPAVSSGSRMRRPRPPSRTIISPIVGSSGEGEGGVVPASTPVLPPAAVMPSIPQTTMVSTSGVNPTGERGVMSSDPQGGDRGTSSEVFILYPVTPPILSRRGDRQTDNPPAPHQLHFPPSPFLPQSGRGSSWGAHYRGAPLSDRGPFIPYTPEADRVQSLRQGQRHVGTDRTSRGHMEVFGDSPREPVRPSLSRHVRPATDEWTYRSRRAPSPSGGYGGPSHFRPEPTRDNLVYDYHHSSGGNTSQWSPPRHTQYRPSGFYDEYDRAHYDDAPPQRRVISRGSYNPSPLLPYRSDPCGPALGSVRRRLDYVPRSQLTAPLCVSEPAVANQEMRAVGEGRSGSESRDQRSAGSRVGPIPGSTDAQPGAASVAEASVAAGNPAPHGDGVPTKMVWIIGHSFVFWAAGHPRSNVIPNHEGTVIRWLGRRGLNWPDLVPWLGRLIRQHGPPNILVVHAGGNDLGKGKSLELIIAIREDLRRIHEAWPHIIIGWSALIPRLAWRTTIPLKKMTVMVRKLNSTIRKIVRSMGGLVINHPGLGVESPQLFRSDGVHLTEEGMGFFIDSICGGVSACLD
ncbi:uncharacterized protein LOC142099582 isoform X2 [Mixophyes fleayi]|uniref:uncharacterized protein LOC142099582 isoform X2 n=1 Tax=Mixophyes fleayi TaxID=3061075 RepID=UPI003F4DF6E0